MERVEDVREDDVRLVDVDGMTVVVVLDDVVEDVSVAGNGLDC